MLIARDPRKDRKVCSSQSLLRFGDFVYQPHTRHSCNFPLAMDIWGLQLLFELLYFAFTAVHQAKNQPMREKKTRRDICIHANVSGLLPHQCERRLVMINRRMPTPMDASSGRFFLQIEPKTLRQKQSWVVTLVSLSDYYDLYALGA